MKKLVLFTFLCMLFVPAWARPVGQLKLSLWGRAAWASPNNIDQISGVDFGIGSTTERVSGVQLDAVYARTTEKLNGLGVALFNHAADVDGVQLGAWSLADRDMAGVQLSAVNITLQQIRGVQLGAVNYAWNARGVQLGVINYAHYLTGVQLGLLNLADNGFLPAMIFLNAHF